MRKGLAIVSVMALVLVGFLALVNPVASNECGKVTIKKCGCPTCYFGGLDVQYWDNDSVPLNTFVTWWLTIEVRNNHDYAIEDVWVKDRLGGELMLMDYDKGVTEEIDAYPGYPDQGTWNYSLHGATDKVFLEWDIGTLAPHTTATFIIGIGTDTNPGGQQEYTTPGEYYLNSGATVKWIDPTVGNNGKQYSAFSNRLMIIVIGEEEE